MFDEVSIGPSRMELCGVEMGLSQNTTPPGFTPPGFERQKTCSLFRECLTTRSDVLYTAWDLSHHNLCDNYHSRLPGSTFPAIRWFQHAKSSPNWTRIIRQIPAQSSAKSRRCLVSFIGRDHPGWFNSSGARRFLHTSSEEWGAANGIATKVGDGSMFTYMRWDPEPSDTLMTDYIRMIKQSRFSLVLRGDHRWSWRLAEVIAAGAIPVILSDGLSLPFENLFNWDGLSIRLPEIAAEDFGSIIRILLAVPMSTVTKMQAGLRQVARRCLSSETAHVHCFIQDLQAAVRTQQHAGFPIGVASGGRACLSQRAH